MTDDAQLLQRYYREHIESAFAELVARHIDLTFSAALRIVGGDRHLAQDVTQIVFADLARKAGSLPRDVVLAGWLYRHACFTAAKAVRSERRRASREKKAMEMIALDDNTGPDWKQIAPILDEAMNQLSASDRDAIVLRFLQRLDLRAVGSALGIGEDAAQKRVSRAVEKLRTFLSRRGVTLTSTALGTTLAIEAVVAAPTGLAASVAAASLTGAVTAGTGIGATLMKLMAITNLKSGIVTAVVVASLVTPLVVQRQAQARLREQDGALRQRTDQLAKLQGDNEQLSKRLAGGNGSRPLPNDRLRELVRLRSEVGRLRKDAKELSQTNANAPLSRNDTLAAMGKMYSERVSQLKQLLEANPAEKIPELQFLDDRNWLVIVDHQRFDTEEHRRSAMISARSAATISFAYGILRPALRQYAKDNNQQFPTDLSQLKPYLFKSSGIGIGLDRAGRENLEHLLQEPDAILDRYEILPRSKVPISVRNHLSEDWVITLKAPVDERDQRNFFGLEDSTGGSGSHVWVRVP